MTTTKPPKVSKKLADLAERYKAPRPTTNELRAAVREAVAKGHRPIDLAELFDVHRQQINKWLHQG